MAEATGNEAFIKASQDVLTFESANTNEAKLKLYGLFKQATVGDNDTAKPSMFNLVAKSKWEAWAANKDMSKEEAQQKYIDYVEELRSKN
ncbi:acyl-CoA-binding protein-like protein [Syncephalis pseudoplumigaleata]|uniref:Acyl-CoA-binding protein-like protein n=1 Tax=Syncephalis pseudoplumigaleata TaxID=1712513 RepID=A0A4P9Z0P0_9FUNG|nr:acyl-CoA-binding protein-like protein [Syncephalis pseudoplumigaleata]|eukprot:RKP25835.1 acyl-CoA-binding protein-like protein [Syncephalis pseudoplumigaleata]